MTYQAIAGVSGVDASTVWRRLDNSQIANANSEITNIRGQTRPSQYQKRQPAVVAISVNWKLENKQEPGRPSNNSAQRRAELTDTRQAACELFKVSRRRQYTQVYRRPELSAMRVGEMSRTLLLKPIVTLVARYYQ